MRKIKKGDTVIVIAGRDSKPAKRGTVKQIFDNGTLLVEGVNLVKKHQKPNPMKGTTGGIVTKEMPIHVSNVAMFNPTTQKADRIAIKKLDDGRRVRIYKSNGEMLDA